METLTRMMPAVNFLRCAPRRIDECAAGAARLGKVEGISSALKRVYWNLAVVIALGSGFAHGQTPTCAPPGCNSVASDGTQNTAMGTGALVKDLPGVSSNWGAGNTAAGYHALYPNTDGQSNTALGANALNSNADGGYNTALGANALYSNNGYFNTATGEEALYFNSASANTATGFRALQLNTTGFANTATGLQALNSNTTGGDNSAVGGDALYSNTTGSNNTASGVEALFSNTTASGNTASGYRALKANTTGASNSAFGGSALQFNLTGNQNTATGALALYSNTSGNYNAASGSQALFANTTASNNTAAGFRALYSTTNGQDNTATGFAALLSNTTGKQNTAVGSGALLSNTTGISNIGIGISAGYAITGSNNIDIGNQGFAADSGTIRIGAPSTQSKAFIAGIFGTHITGSAVYVTANGQLGVIASSERYKTAVTPIGSSDGDKLQRLRPVSFHLKSDPQGALQYGLIAEEVDKVYPELVIRDEAGKIQGVRYEELAPMLLNETQQQRKALATQASELSDLKQQFAHMQKINRDMEVALAQLQAKQSPVAMR